MKKRIGVLVFLKADGPVFDNLVQFEQSVCQLVCWNPDQWTKELAEKVREEAKQKNVTITSFWAGWPGKAVWDMVDGPLTLGLVPAETRAARVATQKKAADFASVLGVKAIITHLGFLPEVPSDPLFKDTVAAVKEVAEYLKKYNMEYWFETGQETPVTMLRLIEEVGTGNLGINLDPANLIMYGKANPIDALDVFGKYVRNIHAKDGIYTTDPMVLGAEVKVGLGRVRFPAFVKRLKEIGYDEEFIIEREISGEKQFNDIKDTISYLKVLIEKEYGNY